MELGSEQGDASSVHGFLLYLEELAALVSRPRVNLTRYL
jgi:hypothetical protein